MNKIIQYLKVKKKSIKNTQTKGNVDTKYFETWTGTSEASLTNKMQNMGERTSGIEGKIQDIDTLVKENAKSKQKKRKTKAKQNKTNK